MSKSNLLYITMVATMGFGLWGILTVGSHLQAPFALGGTWQPADVDAENAIVFSISQSGRYLQLKPRHGQSFHLHWDNHMRNDAGDGVITLKGDQQTVLVHVPASVEPQDELACRFEFTGRINGAWPAVRAVATSSAKPASH